MRYCALVFAAALLALPTAQAETPVPEKSKNTAVEVYDKELAEARQAIEKELRALDPNIPIEKVTRSPWDGVYMVTLKGGHVLYASRNGKHLMRGEMLEIDNGQLTNLTEKVRNTAVAARLKGIETKDLIVFPAKGATKGVVYAFTDVDCGYCRKLHQEVPAMNAMGIEVRYLAFPRGGKQSPAYDKMVQAWCSNDRKQAISELKDGKPITAVAVKGEASKTCAQLVEDQYMLGNQLGVNGTPAMFLENGQAIPGYRPAADLAKMMGITTTLTLPAPSQ